MNTLAADFNDIVSGLLVSLVGFLAIAASLVRLKRRDFSLLHFGLLCLTYGIRWLNETPTVRSLLGFPFSAPYFSTILTYILPIPWSAFLVCIFGRGIYDSQVWVFRSSYVYTIAAVAYDLFRPDQLASTGINPIIVVVWCLIAMANLVLIKGQELTELAVTRAVFFFLCFTVASDNLVNIGFLPWTFHFEHAGFLVMCIGLGYVAVHHVFTNERKLLAIEQELLIARRIQRSNLPGKLPSSDGLDIGARYVPVSAVAGDFYDVRAKEESGIGILVADVSGHGVGAALIGSMLKVGFASQIACLDDPARVLGEINRLLQGKIEHSFVTACSLFIDFEHGKIRYSLAGHPPPFLFRKNEKKMIRLTRAGTILGPFPEASYENSEISLTRGDRLVLYTDGLVETKSKTGDFFGDGRLEALIEANAGETAEVSAGRIVDHVIHWSGKSDATALDDDLTLVVADILGR